MSLVCVQGICVSEVTSRQEITDGVLNSPKEYVGVNTGPEDLTVPWRI